MRNVEVVRVTTLKCLIFNKSGAITPQPQVQGQQLSHGWKGLHTRNTHAKYQSSRLNGSKVMAKVKVFVTDGRTDRQTDRQGKNNMHPDYSGVHKNAKKYNIAVVWGFQSYLDSYLSESLQINGVKNWS